LPSAEADKIASNCPSVRYIVKNEINIFVTVFNLNVFFFFQHEDRGKRTFGGARVQEGEFHISH